MNIDEALEHRKLLKEKNDCTVRALAIALSIPYMTAYGMLIAIGRKRGRGVHIDKLYDSFFPDNQIANPKMEVKSFVPTYCHVGTVYIVHIRAHVFPVVDGKILDINPKWNLNRHVIKAWRVK